MIITILKQKYMCESKKFYTDIRKSQLLGNLNSVIEWDLCAFPMMTDEDGNYKEDRKFLGDDPELVPGTMFVYQGQVIAVESENSIVLPLIRSGIKGLDRVWKEYIQPEIYMFLRSLDGFDILSKEVVDTGTIPKSDTIYYNVTYPLYKLWRSRNGESYKDSKGKVSLKLNIRTNSFFKYTVYMSEWGIYFPKSEVFTEEELCENVSKDIIAWFFENEPRTVFPANEKSPFEEAKGEIDIDSLPSGVVQVAPIP